jgi:CelD/BcsL family acetyltransferase involved in cellulose biosynthesis
MDAVIQGLNGTEGAHAEHRSDTLPNKAEYRNLCSAEPSIPIFSNAWWLDAVAGPDGWDVALARAKGRIVGAMPFYIARRYGMKVIQQPPLTPVLGPWLRVDGGSVTTRLSNQQRIMQSLIEQLPRFDHFSQTWNKDLSNWLPFYWNGFSQSTEYTYVIPKLDDLEGVWSKIDPTRRKHCRSGVARHNLRVRDDLPLDAFLALHKMTLENRGVAQAFSDDCLRRLDAACVERKRRKLHIVVDEAGRPCSATYTVWDDSCAYALLKGSDPAMSHTQASSVCQWKAIQFSATVAPKYDFLGNMNPSIEPYVRSFGTEQTPVFAITKTPSRLLRLRRGLISALAG